MAKQTNIRRRGKAWVVSARVNGTQQRKSCRTRDEAVRLRNQRLRRLPYRADVSVALPPKRDSGASNQSDRIALAVRVLYTRPSPCDTRMGR